MDVTEFLLARIAEDEAVIRHERCDFAGGPYNESQMLAECEASRRIIEAASNVWSGYGSDGSAEMLAETVLCALASVYADHPDYREEWSLTAAR